MVPGWRRVLGDPICFWVREWHEVVPSGGMGCAGDLRLEFLSVCVCVCVRWEAVIRALEGLRVCVGGLSGGAGKGLYSMTRCLLSPSRQLCSEEEADLAQTRPWAHA